MPKTPAIPEDSADGVISLGDINTMLRGMAAGALEAAGGEKYLLQVAKKNPGVFLRFISQFVQNDVTSNLGGYNIVIQQLNIGGGGPIPGVLASPVAEHISATPVRLATMHGEVIENDPSPPEGSGNG